MQLQLHSISLPLLRVAQVCNAFRGHCTIAHPTPRSPSNQPLYQIQLWYTKDFLATASHKSFPRSPASPAHISAASHIVAMEFIDTRMVMYPDLAKEYENLGSLYQRRLYHQLTEALVLFTGNKNYHRDLNMVELYEGFISEFEAKINQSKFVQIMANIAEQFCPVTVVPASSSGASSSSASAASASSNGSSSYGYGGQTLMENIDGLHQAVAFMAVVSDKKDRIGEDGYLLSQMCVAGFRVRIGTSENLEIASTILEESKPRLQSLEGTGAEAVVYSSFHKVSAELYKRIGPADAFYSSTLQFLAYTSLDTLTRSEQIDLAISMSIAALVGDNMFNFGEVLAEPVMDILKSESGYVWLYEVLHAFSSGDVDAGTQLIGKYQAQIAKVPALAGSMEKLKQKLAILSVMRMIFERPAEERNISFDDIAAATKLPVEQVEWLLMRAMAKDLIRGKIDEIDRVIRISWLRPRVLNAMQMAQLSEKLKAWAATVHNTLVFIEGETPELFQ